MGARTTTALLGALLLVITGLGYAGTHASGWAGGHRSASTTPAAAPARPTAAAAAAQTPRAAAPVQRVAPHSTPDRPGSPSTPSTPRATTPTPGKRLLGPGDSGPAVRALQARLRQIAWYAGDVTDDYGTRTTAAVRGFQAKRGIAVTGYVDARTRRRLAAMTHPPTAAELANKVTPMGNTPGRLDPRCTTGRAICIDKASRTLRWVVDGTVRRTVDVRFGASYSPTREGVFHVYWKDATHVSKLYGSAMPFSMFFSRGQAVHYSSDFAARGYAGASHGCVNVRDYAGVKWLFSHVRVGDKVVIYWS